MPATFSLKEAAAIADVPERAVRKAIEARTIRPRMIRAGRAHRYRFNARDLLLLKLVTAFPLPLRQADKRALEDILRSRRDSSGRWRCSDGDIAVRTGDLEMRVALGPLRNALADRLVTFRRGRRRIISDPDILGGEPVFKGTRIPLAHVAALFAKRVPIEEIAEDYPALDAGDLRFAAMVARMRPNPGRPQGPLVLVRAGQTVVTNDRATSPGAAPSR